MMKTLVLFMLFTSSASSLVSLGETLDQMDNKETPGGAQLLPAGALEDISISHEQGILTVTLKTNRLLEPTVFKLDNPPRLVLDFQNTVNKAPFRRLPLNAASAKRLRVGQFQSDSPKIARVVFDLEKQFGDYRITSDKTSVHVTLFSGEQGTDESGSGNTGQSADTVVDHTVTNKSSVAATAAIPSANKSTQEMKTRTTTVFSAESQETAELIEPTSQSLEKTLDLIGKSVENFRKQLESVACTELVSQTKLGKKNSVIYKKNHEYDYMIFMNTYGNEMNVGESRQKKKTKGKSKDMPLLVTEGFPTLLFIFHPYYQGSFEYSYSGNEVVDGNTSIIIDFKHIHGERSTSVLALEGENYPLELTGTAWIDPDSHNIRRIKSELIKPMEALGLLSFNSDVHYQPMQFTSVAPAYWMPETATVEVMTKKQHWINTHRFKDYKMFSVSTENSITLQ